MSDRDDSKITIESATSPGFTQRVDRAKYTAMRSALLAVLPASPPGITVAEAKTALLPRLPDALFPGGDKVGWWLKAVQLDLEAKGMIRRGEGNPVRLFDASKKRGQSDTSDRSARRLRAPVKGKDSARPIAPTIRAYNRVQTPGDRAICNLLAREIHAILPDAENKIWHRHPVWFLDGNPIVGYVRLKSCMRLLFWSGQSFGEPALLPEGTFKAAEARYTSVDDIDVVALRRWLRKGRTIQWDYKNIVKRKGKLERIR